MDGYTSFSFEIRVELERKLLQGRNCVSGEDLLKRPSRIERELSIARALNVREGLSTLQTAGRPVRSVLLGYIVIKDRV